MIKLESWSGSDIGLVRKQNEDSVGCFPELDLFVVADGMGGRSAGEVASRMAVDIVHEFFRNHGNESLPSGGRLARAFAKWMGTSAPPPEPSVEEALQAAVELANQRIHASGLAQTESTRGSMGSTVVALKVDPKTSRIGWAHVGDSRLYRLRAGQLNLLTADHTLFGEAYQERTTEVPTDLPHTNMLLQALGIRPEVTVATGSDSAAARDIYLLCTDGISGLVDASVLLEQLKIERSLKETGEELIRLANEAGGKDNASLVLVRVVES